MSHMCCHRVLVVTAEVDVREATEEHGEGEEVRGGGRSEGAEEK